MTTLGLFATAACIRFAYVKGVWASPWVRYPMVDSQAYHERALAILAGDWIGDSVFYQDPLYPYFLAGLYALFGVGSLGVLVAQVLLDSLTVVLIHLTARRIFDERVALVAGLIACFYKVLFYYDALLLKVPLTLFLISLALFLAVRADDRGTPRSWLAAGFAFGLAALTRGNYLLFAPVLVAWPCFANGVDRRKRLAAASLTAAGIAAAILPVTARNYAVSGDLVLITSQAGQNFYIGNHRGNRTGVYEAPPFVVANPVKEERDFRVEAERRTGRELTPSELSRFWFREAFAEIRARPGRWARLLLRKARIFANNHEVPDNQSYAFFATNVSPLLRVPMPTFGILLPLAVCGAVFARSNRRARILTSFGVLYAASVILFFNMSRYRIPVLAAVIPLAASGGAELVRRLRARDVRAAVPTVLLLAVAWPFVFHDVSPEDFSRVHVNMGMAHENRAAAHRLSPGEDPVAGGDTRRTVEDEVEALRDLAETEYRKALEINPRNRRAERGLRSLLVARVVDHEKAGRYERALERAFVLTNSFPEFAEGFALLGSAYAHLGRNEEAREALQRALVLAPRNRRARETLQRMSATERNEPPAHAGAD